MFVHFLLIGERNFIIICQRFFVVFIIFSEMASERDRSKLSNPNKHIPKDAQVIMSILKELGISDYEPRVINQLLEFTYRKYSDKTITSSADGFTYCLFCMRLGYVTCILDDAKVYTNHAKKKVIDLDDVKLASQMVLDKAFTAPPPRDVISDI